MFSGTVPSRSPNDDFNGLSFQPTAGDPINVPRSAPGAPGAGAGIPDVPLSQIMRDRPSRQTNATIRYAYVVPMDNDMSRQRCKRLETPGMLAFVEEPSGMEDGGVHDPVTQSRNGRKRSLVGGQYPNGTNGYDKVTSLVSLSYLMRTDPVTTQVNMWELDPRSFEDSVVGKGKGHEDANNPSFSAAVEGGAPKPTDKTKQELFNNSCIQWITARVLRTLGPHNFVGLFNNDPMLVNHLTEDGVSPGVAQAAIEGDDDSFKSLKEDKKNLIFPFETEDYMFLSPFLIPKGYTSYKADDDKTTVGILMRNRIASRHVGHLRSKRQFRSKGSVDESEDQELQSRSKGFVDESEDQELQSRSKGFVDESEDQELQRVLCEEFVPDGMKSGTKYSQMANGNYTLPTTEPSNQDKPYLRLDSTQFVSANYLNNENNSNPANPHDDVRYRALYQSVYFGRGGNVFKKYEGDNKRYNTCFVNEAVGLLSPHCLGNFSPAGFVLYKYSTAGMDEISEKMLDASQHGLFEIVVGGLSTVTEFAFNHERYMNERLHGCGDKDINVYPTLEEKRRLRTSTLDELYVLVVGVVIHRTVENFMNGESVPGTKNLRLVRCTSEELYKYSTPDPYTEEINESDEVTKISSNDKWFEDYGIEHPPSSQFRRMKSAGLHRNELILGGWRIGKVLDTAATRMMPGYTQNAVLDPSTFGVTVDVDIEWVSSIDLHDKYWSVEGYSK
jgi:hypothetical protein